MHTTLKKQRLKKMIQGDDCKDTREKNKEDKDTREKNTCSESLRYSEFKSGEWK